MSSETNGSRLSDEQILNLGQKASDALNNPIFRIEYDHLCTKYYRDWIEADPAHTKEMAFLKAKHLVLNEIMRDFAGMVDHAQRIYADIQKSNDPQAQESKRLDEQGYGLNYGQGEAS